MEGLESLSPAEQKEFAKWMKFHGVYKTLKKQMEGEENEESEESNEEYKMTGSKMLMAMKNPGVERMK